MTTQATLTRKVKPTKTPRRNEHGDDRIVYRADDFPKATPLNAWMHRCLSDFVTVLVDYAAHGERPNADAIALAFALPPSVTNRWSGALASQLRHWRATGMAPAVVPPITSALVAKAIADGFDDDVQFPCEWFGVDIEPDDSWAALAELARDAGPEHGSRLLTYIEVHLNWLDSEEHRPSASWR